MTVTSQGLDALPAADCGDRAAARPPISITTGDLTQVDMLSELHRQCFAEVWNADEIRTLITTLGAFAVVARIAGDVAGYALVRVAADEGEILALGVVPEQRRGGVARELVAALTFHAIVRGARRMVLEVSVDNPAGKALYAAAGFTPVGHRRDYYRRPEGGAVDALIMACELPVATSATICAAAADADRARQPADQGQSQGPPRRSAR